MPLPTQFACIQPVDHPRQPRCGQGTERTASSRATEAAWHSPSPGAVVRAAALADLVNEGPGWRQRQDVGEKKDST
jgi:hypothetical protein